MKEITVNQYISKCPKEVQNKLKDVRIAIQKAAPKSQERMDYFEMPGYSYEGYDYDGLFVWFSYKKPYVRLHVRPPVLQNHKKEVEIYTTTKSIVSFPETEKMPIALIKKLVKASVAAMKERKAAKK